MTFRSIILILTAVGIWNPLSSKKETRPEAKLDGLKGWEVYLAEGRTDTGIKYWQKALKLDASDPLVHLGLADLEEENGRPSAAIEEYEKSFQGFVQRLAGRNGDLPVDDVLSAPGATFALQRMYALREFSPDGQALSSEKLAELAGKNLPPSLLDLYRCCLMWSLLEVGKWDESEEVRRGLRFAENYLVIGPFANDEGAGLRECFPAEAIFDPRGEYKGKVRSIGWRPLIPPKWGYVDLGAVVAPSWPATAYIATAIHASEKGEAVLGIGHGGAVKVWVNEQCTTIRDACHVAFPDQISVPVQLRDGWNTVIIKTAAKSDAFGLYLRFISAPNTISWWDGRGSFPAGGGFSLEQQGNEWKSDTDDFLAGISQAEGCVRALLLHFRAADQRARYVLDQRENDDLVCLRAALELYPKSPMLNYYLGTAEREWNLSRAAYQKTSAAAPKSVRARQCLAYGYLESDLYRNAGPYIQEAIALNGESAYSHYLFGNLLSKECGKTAASAEYDKAYRAAPRSSEYYLSLIESRGSLTTPDGRLEHYRNILAMNVAERSARTAMIDVQLSLGQSKEAEASMYEGLRVNPYDADLYTPLIRYYRNSGMPDDAERLAVEALNVCPDSNPQNREMGFVLWEKGRTEEALEAWREALTTKPQDSWLEGYVDHHFASGEDYYDPYRIDYASVSAPKSVHEKANAVVLLDHQVCKVHENGNSSRTFHKIVKILTDVGADQNRRETIYYEKDRQRVKIKRARTSRPDGTFYDAPKPREVSAVQGGGQGSFTYGDYYVQVLDLPAVERGVVTDVEYEIEDIGENLHADYFGDTFYVGSYEPTAHCEYVLITPASRTFYRSVVGLEDKVEIKEEKAGKEKVYRWVYTDQPLIEREPDMPAYPEVFPHIRISTFSSWDQMAKWYWDLIKDQMVMTELLKEKTAEVLEKYVDTLTAKTPDMVRKKPTDTDKVRAVNHFVNDEIRYLGLEFGIHGYKPHRAAEVAASQYGDCKDKAILELAMLKELGIEGRIALLRTRQKGRIDFDLPMLGIFDHAIVYLPNVDGVPLTLDGTAQFHGVGEIPRMDQGVPLLTIGENGSWSFVGVPIDPVEKSGSGYLTELSLDGDGTAVGSRRQDAVGLNNVYLRYMFENQGKVQERIESALGGSFPGTKVTAWNSSKTNYADRNEWFQYEFKIPEFAGKKNEEMTFRPVFLPSKYSKAYAVTDQRKHDLVIDGGAGTKWFRSEKTTIRFPSDYKPSSVPKEVNLETPFGKVWTRWSVRLTDIEYESRIEWSAVRVTPEEYPQFREFCRMLDSVEEERVVLTKTASGSKQ